MRASARYCQQEVRGCQCGAKGSPPHSVEVKWCVKCGGWQSTVGEFARYCPEHAVERPA